MAKVGPVTGDEVRGFRVRMGWTQEILAEMLEISVRTLSRYETGRSSPTKSIRYHLNVLGIKNAAQ